MLKLTMNPRKKSKRFRAIPHRLRLPSSSMMETDGDENQEVAKDLLLENLQAMLHQEASGRYAHTDYLSMTNWQQNVYQLPKKLQFEHAPHSHGTNTRIDEYCREQIVEWSFRVVDYFRIDREVVAVSLSFLDRFLGTCKCDRTTFKLAATTTLHLAVKLLYPCKLADLGILSDLSRGEFDMNDVSDMEAHILHALQWNLSPPTATAFASIFLDYYFASTSMLHLSVTDLDDITDVSCFFCELAHCDYFFVPVRASSVALAAILNALEGMFGPENSIATHLMTTAQGHGMVPQHELSAARNRLWELYERSEECALHNDKSSKEDHAMWHGNIFVKKMTTVNSSPVSVSKPCHSATDFGSSSHKRMLRHESW